MRKLGPWKPRQITVTAVFVLSVIYGVDALLTGGDSSSKPSQDKADTAKAKVLKVSETFGPAVPVEVELPPGPTREALLEADRWRQREWGRTDPFAGESWLLDKDVVTEVRAPAKGDTVLRATSYSPEGWRAVVGGRVLQEGDEYLGGRVMKISKGEVVMRGDGWKKTLRFPEKEGY